MKRRRFFRLAAAAPFAAAAMVTGAASAPARPSADIAGAVARAMKRGLEGFHLDPPRGWGTRSDKGLGPDALEEIHKAIWAEPETPTQEEEAA